MAKRKNRNTTPNLPQEALDRARQQLNKEEEENEETPAEVNAEAPRTSSRAARRERRERRPSTPGYRAQPERIQYSKRRKEVLDNETMERMLANPTKFVSEEELRQEYGHVLTDLKNMGLLAGVLMLALVLLAQFI